MIKHYNSNYGIAIFLALFIVFLFFRPSFLWGQTYTPGGVINNNNEKYKDSLKHQRDLIDIMLIILNKNTAKRTDDALKVYSKLHISASPGVQYTLQTGLAATVVGNAGFYTNDYHVTNISSVLASIAYSEKQQFFVPVHSSVFTKNNKYFLFGDWRFYKYPQLTYGLGGFTTLADGYLIDYYYLRVYQNLLKKIGKSLYAGAGFQYDKHWGIKEVNVAPDSTDFAKYGLSSSSISSGISLNLLYDSRKNSINPEGGSEYCNIVFRQNFGFLGSNENWNSVIVDLRKYIALPHGNVLAFWNYDWLVLSGNPPYLDLPTTEGDTYGNTERGYVQGRFISKKMIDMEGEFRYHILRNGLLGGVVFANAATFSEIYTGKFEVIEPAAGAGIRLKFNKFSKANVCIDYAFGTNGSHGIFAALGEVF
jgi:hypothetical protein